MKTIESLQNEINEIKSFYTPGKDELLSDSKSGKRIGFLNLCIEYIKTNPSVEFIKSEIKRTEKKLEIIMKSKPDVWYLNEYPKSTTKSFQDSYLGGKKLSVKF